ncbi:MAG: ABC transporter permease [Micropepsaceae bacterium]
MSREPEGPDQKRPASVVYERPKKTKRSVLFADVFARYAISAGGLIVIVAVFTIMAFLIYVCLPLLDGGHVTKTRHYALAASAGSLLEPQLDEHQTIAVTLTADGAVRAFHARTGTALEVPAFDIGGLTASTVASTLRGDDILFGFPDGTVRTGKLELRAQVMPTDRASAGLRELDERDSTDGKLVYSKIPGQFRKTGVEISLEPAVQIADAGVAVLKADYRLGGTAERPLKTFVTLDASGKLRLTQAYSEINMMTGEAATQLFNAEIPIAVSAADVTKLLLNTPGDRVLIALRDGTIYRYNTRDFAHPKLAETTKTLPPGVQLSALTYLNGENSIVVGGSDGSVSIWFGVDRQSKETVDGIVLTKIHADFAKQPAAITDIRVSQRTRMFTTTDASGNVWIRHGTTESTLLALPGTPDPQGLQATVFSPKDDGVLGIGKNGKTILWGIDVPHPETTLKSLFGLVWYEGYTEPAYVWQSTAGTDAAEPKLSLVPLIFGTFKAAIYSLLVAVPIALLAAVYTSEFLHAQTRAVVKPVMELMATLPSVVIGFVAALVLSPIVENWIAAIVIAFAVVPLSLITAAFLWQLLPPPISNMLEGIPKLIGFTAMVAFAIWLCVAIGPFVESAFFAGDFKKWTAGGGSALPFLFLLLLPVSFAAVFMTASAAFGKAYSTRLREQAHGTAALLEMVRWVILAFAALALAWTLAAASEAFGADVRGGVVDTYVQRNALITAFAIAFAVIPLIYTISEDALNAVPAYLRSGSLACGASRWQTANWIIVPTAASGIFSAVMIGLGRAVGETMIVLMASGNTPVLDLNLFNGLRSLAANINVELPEAVRDSSLYRTLFLCALSLFALTFVINTVAELIRQRYRRRTAQL